MPGNWIDANDLSVQADCYKRTALRAEEIKRTLKDMARGAIVAGLSIEEIAAACGCSEATVKEWVK